jgi:hypothetical protein
MSERFKDQVVVVTGGGRGIGGRGSNTASKAQPSSCRAPRDAPDGRSVTRGARPSGVL